MEMPLAKSIGLKLQYQGKVRDIYAIDDSNMLIVATDRISAFDVVFDQLIAKKGVILTSVSNFWFDKTSHIIPNHIIKKPLTSILASDKASLIKGRAAIVKKLKPLKIEAIVRGYLIGSGWHDYQKTGTVCGIKLPKNLKLADKLPSPIYTPSTKAKLGSHDINISLEQSADIVGSSLANYIKKISIKIYNFAYEYALKRGVIIADTKLEFGLDENNQLILIDEILTPDSSRFWEKNDYKAGVSPKSFDKQIIRDYLQTTKWDKSPPPPELPYKIIEKTKKRYQQLSDMLQIK